MAGEMGNTITYDNIDANKMLNKAGLLELSGQIKGYIQANAGGGASYTAGNNVSIDNDTINVRIVPKVITINQSTTAANMSADNKAYLNNTFVNGYVNYPCIIKAGLSYGLQGYYYYYMTDSNMMAFVGMSFAPNDTSYGGFQYILLNFTNNELSQITWNAWGVSSNRLPAEGIRLPAGQSPTGSASTVGSAMEYIKNNYAKKVELPPIPADPSADGTYVLQNTVSSGTATYSWGTPSGGGGGTTYTAGTGISIENGVISLNLASAEEEVF